MEKKEKQQNSLSNVSGQSKRVLLEQMNADEVIHKLYLKIAGKLEVIMYEVDSIKLVALKNAGRLPKELELEADLQLEKFVSEMIQMKKDLEEK